MLRSMKLLTFAATLFLTNINILDTNTFKYLQLKKGILCLIPL